jgi:hypothetical protein
MMSDCSEGTRLRGSQSPHAWVAWFNFSEEDGLWHGRTPSQPSIDGVASADLNDCKVQLNTSFLCGYINERKANQKPIMLIPIDRIEEPPDGTEVVNHLCT